MNDTEKNTIRRETAVFLTGLPDYIEKNPQHALSALCLAVGKYLRWIAPILEKGQIEPIYPGLLVQPRPITGLADGFLKIGLEKFHENGAINLPAEFASIRRELLKIQKQIGGGK